MDGVPKQFTNKKLILLISSFWVVFCASRILQAVAGARLQGYDLYLPLTIVNYASWLFWIPLTFLILRISKKHPVHRPNISRGLLMHALFAFLVISIHYAYEWVVMYITSNYLFPDKKVEEYIPFVLYSLHLPVLMYILIVAVHQGVDHVIKFQEAMFKNLNLEAQLFSAQNEALKMQIHPHFLFNTHHSIISLINKHKNVEAIEMLSGLSDLLRKTLSLTKGNYVKVEEEIEIVRLYLDIQERRFSERLEVAYDIDENVKAARIPPFILQPLVENALVHGSQPISDKVLVEVAVKGSDARLELTISDNGKGISRPIPNGIGLANTRMRLEKYYGRDFVFSLGNNKSRGAVAHISLPLSYE